MHTDVPATISPEALAMLDLVGASRLLPGIAVMEGVTHLTLAVLRSVGLGSGSGVRLVDCTTAVESTRERHLVAKELVDMDAEWVVDAPGDSEDVKTRNAVLAVSRLVAGLVDALQAKDREVAAAPAGVGQANTSYVVTQTEEERGFTLAAYDSDEVKRQRGVLVQMYNIQSTRAHNMPTHAGMKKIAYWVRSEGCWPDPSRVSLDSMRRDPTDSSLLKFRRIAYGVMVIAAGEKVGPTTRHEGACGSKKHSTQWAHGDVLEELLSELSEAADKLPEAEMASVVGVMHESMFKSTSRGNESVTLAASQQLCKVVDYVAQSKMAAAHALAAAAAVRTGGGGGGGGSGSRPAAAGKEKKRGAPAPSAASDKPSKNGKPGKASRPAVPSKWQDEEGALGPNGLARKKGGNPAGAACERRAKGECPFKTCSYSHE